MLAKISGILVILIVMSSYVVFITNVLKAADTFTLPETIVEKYVKPRSIKIFGKDIKYRNAYIVKVELEPGEVYDVEIEHEVYDSIEVGTVHTFSVYKDTKKQMCELVMID